MIVWFLEQQNFGPLVFLPGRHCICIVSCDPVQTKSFQRAVHLLFWWLYEDMEGDLRFNGVPDGAKTRAGKRKRASEDSDNISMPQASSGENLLCEPAHLDEEQSLGAEAAEASHADRQLALFLGLCGISKEAVCTEGLARYCSAYGYGTATERAEILPQIERELEAGDMSRIISFFRHFLEEGFEAFAAELYGWIQEARHKTSEDAEQSAIADNEESLHYLDKDKRDLLRIFRVFLEEVAQGSCTPFERRLRAEILEREVLSAEAEQVAGSMYDALLPNEVEAWNKKLHESDLDAYWLPA